MLTFRVLEHGVDRLGQSRRIPKGDQDSPAVSQGFLGMQVGSRDNRLPGPERVREGATRDLLRVEVWRDIDIAGKEQLDDVPLGHVFIDERNIVLETEALDRLDELVAVDLAIAATQLGVGLTRDQVEGRRMAGNDRRHCLDHELDTLPGVHEAER